MIPVTAGPFPAAYWGVEAEGLSASQFLGFLVVFIDFTGDSSASQQAPGFWETVKKVNQCAAQQASKLRFASLAGVEDNWLLNTVFGNNASAVSRLVLGPDRGESGGALAVSALAAKYSTPALEKAGNKLATVEVEPTLQFVFSRSVTQLGGTTFGRFGVGALRVAGKASAFALKPQIIYDTGIYVGALYACTQ
jgi:hypothetical protein